MDKAQKPDPVLEKVVVEKIVNVDKPITVPREIKQQTSKKNERCAIPKNIKTGTN